MVTSPCCSHLPLTTSIPDITQGKPASTRFGPRSDGRGQALQSGEEPGTPHHTFSDSGGDRHRAKPDCGNPCSTSSSVFSITKILTANVTAEGRTDGQTEKTQSHQNQRDASHWTKVQSIGENGAAELPVKSTYCTCRRSVFKSSTQAGRFTAIYNSYALS